jgi:hypothetical protein
MDDDGQALPDWLPTLEKGRHMPDRPQFCAMEAAAWLAGEKSSDHPRSVHAVIAQAARVANDFLPEDERQGLWPLVLASIGTGARWRPILWYQLVHYGLIMQLKYPGDPRKVWEELLKRHAFLTGRKLVIPRRVSATRLHAKDAIDSKRDVVGATTASTNSG